MGRLASFQNRAVRLFAAIAVATAAVSSNPAILRAEPSELPAAVPGAGPELAPTFVLPAGLQDRIALGIASHLNTPESGLAPIDTEVRWDFRYQYLAGGIQPGSGWASWVPNGTFPIGTAREMARQGALPVFTYYQLLGAYGPCAPCDEKQRNIAQLNDRALMARYFSDFALLMRRLGPQAHEGVSGYGSPVIVHVEPDLSGFVMQALRDGKGCGSFCVGSADDPAGLTAAVEATGLPELSDLPNTYQGVSWAFLRLRDRYAPNVLLGFHVSNWATNTDVGSSTDRALDAERLGEAVGRFAAAGGATRVSGMPDDLTTYDLLFNDPADRDAGFMKAQAGKPTYWWDRLNLAAPNFERWQRYIAAAVRVTSRPAIAWQIPVGNQVFRSMNNYPGHYQDNKVEYFLSHTDELQAHGIVGLMFARGGGSGNASVFDDALDGVTNPEPICTTDGISQGRVCNAREALTTEDDGGFLRLAAQQYYARGFLPLSDSSLAAVHEPAASASAIALRPAAPFWAAARAGSPSTISARPNEKVTIPVVAGADRDATVTVKLELRHPSGALAHEALFERVLLAAGVDQEFVLGWTVPTGAGTGDYALKVGVFSPDWKTLHTWNDRAASISVSAI